MELCKICNGLDWEDGKHKCPPVFEAWFKDDGEYDSRKIHARDAEAAAEKFAEYDDQHSAEFLIVGGSEAEIWVRQPATGEIKKFTVRGESVPQYYATAIE